MTCRRDAPIARSNPSSWVRWVTRIVKVLKMMNAPTTTPSAAKPSRRPVRRSTNSPTSWLSLRTIWSGSIDVVAQARATHAATRRSSADGHPGIAAHVHRVEPAGGRGDLLRRGQVEGEERERTGVGASPSRNRPTRSNDRRGPGRQHVDAVADVEPGRRGRCRGRSPARRHRAGARLRGTAVVDEQQRPALAPAHERDAGRGHALVDRVTVAPDELRVALHEPVCAWPRRRSPRTWSTAESGMRRRVVVAAHRRARTTRSTSDSDCANTRLNDASSVSVNT